MTDTVILFKNIITHFRNIRSYKQCVAYITETERLSETVTTGQFNYTHHQASSPVVKTSAALGTGKPRLFHVRVAIPLPCRFSVVWVCRQTGGELSTETLHWKLSFGIQEPKLPKGRVQHLIFNSLDSEKPPNSIVISEIKCTDLTHDLEVPGTFTGFRQKWSPIIHSYLQSTKMRFTNHTPWLVIFVSVKTAKTSPW